MAEKKLNKKYLRIYARFFKRVGTFAIAIAFIAVLAATALYGTINFTSKNYKSYYNIMVKEHAYYERVRENLKSELASLDLPDGITADGIYSAMDMDEFNIYAGKYLLYVCKKTFSDPDTVFEAEYRTKSLDEYFSDEKYTVLDKNAVIKCISDSVKFMPDEKFNRAFDRVNTALDERTSGEYILADVYNMVEGSAFRFFDALLIAGLLLFMIYKLNSRHLKRSLFIIGSASLVASSALLIPSAQIYRVLMKFVSHGQSSFARELLSVAHERTAKALIVWALVFFVISVLVYIPTLVIYAKHRAKIHRSKRKK